MSNPAPPPPPSCPSKMCQAPTLNCFILLMGGGRTYELSGNTCINQRPIGLRTRATTSSVSGIGGKDVKGDARCGPCRYHMFPREARPSQGTGSWLQSTPMSTISRLCSWCFKPPGRLYGTSENPPSLPGNK